MKESRARVAVLVCGSIAFNSGLLKAKESNYYYRNFNQSAKLSKFKYK